MGDKSKVKAIFGSPTRTTEIIDWLKDHGAKDTSNYSLSDYSHDNWLFFVDPYHHVCKLMEGTLYFLFDIEKLAHWRASDGGGYYYINEEMKVMSSIDDGTLTDETRYKVGNYFRAKFEAEKVCDQIKKILDTEHGDEKTYEFNGGL